MRPLTIICGGCQRHFQVECSSDSPERHGCLYPHADWGDEEERDMEAMDDDSFVQRLRDCRAQLIVPGFYNVSREIMDRLLTMAERGAR